MAAGRAPVQAAGARSPSRSEESTMSERPPQAPPGDQAPTPPGPTPTEPLPPAATATQALPPPAPVAPGPRAGRRLVRRTDRRIIAGVAGGIADYLGLEPWLVRIAFVVLVPFGGFGALAYLIGWLLVPPATTTDPLGQPPASTSTTEPLGRAPATISTSAASAAAAEPTTLPPPD